MKAEKLQQAYESAIYAISRIQDVYTHLQDFDEMMGGSGITEELGAEIDRSEKRLKKILEENFKSLLTPIKSKK
jgi:hypothetical protein